MPNAATFTKGNRPISRFSIWRSLPRRCPLWTLDEYAETRVAQRISWLGGVAQVQVLGAQKYAVHAQMDPHKLASRQIGHQRSGDGLKS